MGKQLDTCGFCGARIHPSEFEKGRAVVLLKKVWCQRCVDKEIKRQKDKRLRTLAPRVDPVESRPVHRTPLVICVDDEKRVLTSLQRLLSAEPYEFWTTDKPEVALDWVRTREIDLVIADYRMPEMSGTSLLQGVMATSPSTARVMLTGYPGDPGVLAGEEKHLMVVCAKPWDDEELKRTIRERLPDGRWSENPF